MKRITIILMSIAALAIASSCNKNINPEAPGDGLVYKTIHLSASEILTNKAAFGEKEGKSYPLLWSSGDKVIISVNNDPDLTQELSVTPTDGGKSAEFGACTLALPASGEITIRVTTNTTIASGGTAATVKHSPNVDESQVPQAASCDPESIILFAKETYASKDDVPGDIALSFSHATAYGLMTISGIDLGGETVKFVELQAMSPDIKIAGNVTVDGDGVLSTGSHTSLTMRGISDLSSPIWFAIAPSELSGPSALAIHVVTSADRHFEKILDCSSKPLIFQAGHISKFGVNFSGIASTARQVKTARDFVLLKNAINNDDYGYWLNGDSEVMLANDIDYAGASFTGTSILPAGVTFNGQNHAIIDAKLTAVVFSTVNGTVKNLKIQSCTSSRALFNSVASTGVLDNLTIDNNTTYTCPWSSNNMGFVTLENHGLIENCEVAATINAGDPERAAFNFGVFCPKCTDGRFVNCVNKSDVTIATSTRANGCSLGGIVGVIESTQENSINILDECDNQGNLTLTLNIPSSSFHRICCIGGIAGGDYKGGTGNSGVWKDASYPSSGVIYKCTNSGAITMNYYSTSSTANNGSVGISLGGVVGATINDISYCSNSGFVIANLNNDENTNVTLAPKIGGVVGAAHGKVLNCDNESSAYIEINGKVAKAHNALYNGTGPVSNPAFGGVAGCVGCGGSASTNLDGAATNSNTAGSAIQDCKNKSANIINNTTYTPNSDYSDSFLGSVCGWTKAANSGNADLAGTGLPVLNPQ